MRPTLALRLSFVTLTLACRDPTSSDQRLVIMPPANRTVEAARSLQLSTRGGRGTISWESSDQAVARVSSSGYLTAVFPGVVTITARRGPQSAKLSLMVAPARLDVAPSPVVLELYESQRLTVTARDADGAVLSGVQLVWGTEDAHIAVVGASTGVVTGLAKGTTTITVKGWGAAGSVTVTVGLPGPPVSVSLLPVSITLASGSVEQLTARGYDLAGRTTNLSFTWASADPAVATVNGDGTVTAIAPGATTVTASVGALRATATLSVVPAIVMAGAVAFTRMTDLGLSHWTSDVLYSVADGTLRSMSRPSQFAWIAAPAWSADGTRLAVEVIHDFIQGEWLEYTSDIYMLDGAAPGASQWRALTTNGLSTLPSWSPDGTRIARVQRPEVWSSSNDIYLSDVNGGEPVRLTHHVGWYGRPAWSPDGQQLAFSAYLEGRDDSEIFIVNADGTGLAGLSAGGAWDVDPSWSSDGTRLAFVSYRATSTGVGQYGVYVMDLDGGNVRHLISLFAYPSGVAWSPDGRQIMFAASGAVYVVNADGSALSRVTTPRPGSWDSTPAWRR